MAERQYILPLHSDAWRRAMLDFIDFQAVRALSTVEDEVDIPCLGKLFGKNLFSGSEFCVTVGIRI